MEGTGKPDYARCVSISTRGAQKEMVLPSLLAIIIPVATGLLLGVSGLIFMAGIGLATQDPTALRILGIVGISGAIFFTALALPGLAAGYGLGTVKFSPDFSNGLNAIGHSGNAPGYAAASIYLPEYEICIGLTDNTEAGESVAISYTNLLNVIIIHFEEMR